MEECVHQLVSAGVLLAVDLYFARHLLQRPSHPALPFLAYLLAAAREGHLCVHVRGNTVFPACGEGQEEALAASAQALHAMRMDRWVVEEEGRWYLYRQWETEQKFLRHKRRLLTYRPQLNLDTEALKSRLAQASLEPEQRAAILDSADRSLSLICGGPGTGKTYTAGLLVRHFLTLAPLRAAAAAPTGKAAARLKEALGGLIPCTTLHALLRQPYLMEDLLIVDEGSMIDAETWAALLQAVKPGARLVVLGDEGQLPPVEAGQFFVDLLREEACLSRLRTCRRTDLAEILHWAAATKQGEPIPTHPLPPLAELIPFLASRLSPYTGSTCVLTPLRRGPYGSLSLNEKIHAYRLAGTSRPELLRIPILVTRNDSQLGVCNGDTGWLLPGGEEVHFTLDGGKVVSRFLLPAYEYGYALSVHKSQGSEYDHVIVLLPTGSERLGREMLYTALTRAKKKVEVYADAGVLPRLLAHQAQRASGATCF